MKTCSNCGTANKETSRFCLECAAPLVEETTERAPRRHIPRRRLAMYVATGLVALALLVGGIASLVIFTGGAAPKKGALESAGDFLNGIAGNGQAEGAAKKAEKSEKRKLPARAAALGAEVRTRDLVVSVSGSRSSGGAAVMRPADGDSYVVCDVHVRNAGSRPVLVSSLLQTSLQDRAGKVYGTGLYFPGPPFGEGVLQAGGQASGRVAFEVPARSGDLYFVFDPEVLRDGEEIAVRLF